MKKNKKYTIIILLILIVIIGGIVVIRNPQKWSELEFEGVILEVSVQSDDEIRLIIERTTNIYGDSINSLGISEDTKLVSASGNIISIAELEKGMGVKVSLKDAFTEEIPFYYPKSIYSQFCNKIPNYVLELVFLIKL